MKDLWINRLKIASRKLLDEDSPEWWDGFHNIVARNETSHDDDNPYVKYHEDAPYKAYRAGAMAGESLLRTLNPAVTVPPLVADKVDELVGRLNDLSETKTGD